MCRLIVFLALSSATSFAGQSSIVGTWHVQKWLVRSGDGKVGEFCDGAHGLLTYGRNGYVSTAINCPAKRVARHEPADDYGRKFFYAGTYKVKEDVIYKQITNSSFEGLIGKSVLRRIEKVTEHELILSGPFGPNGGSLWIRWTK